MAPAERQTLALAPSRGPPGDSTLPRLESTTILFLLMVTSDAPPAIDTKQNAKRYTKAAFIKWLSLDRLYPATRPNESHSTSRIVALDPIDAALRFHRREGPRAWAIVHRHAGRRISPPHPGRSARRGQAARRDLNRDLWIKYLLQSTFALSLRRWLL